MIDDNKFDLTSNKKALDDWAKPAPHLFPTDNDSPKPTDRDDPVTDLDECAARDIAPTSTRSVSKAIKIFYKTWWNDNKHEFTEIGRGIIGIVSFIVVACLVCAVYIGNVTILIKLVQLLGSYPVDSNGNVTFGGFEVVFAVCGGAFLCYLEYHLIKHVRKINSIYKEL